MALRFDRFLGRLRSFRGNDGGNVAIIFGLSLIPMMLAMGSAIDYGHGNSVKTRIQAALDATGLMVAQQVGLMPDDELIEQAQQIFAANFHTESGVTISPLNVGVTEQIITLSAAATVDTYLMDIVGIDYMEVGASTEITRSEDSYEVVLVLDNTGSMGGSKIAALQDATELLINNLFGEAENHPLLDMGLVPFSHTVNVGTDNAGAGWMDAHGLNPLHAENFDDAFVEAGLTRFDLYDQLRNYDWPGCVEARAYPLDVTDEEASAANPNTLFVPYFAPDEPDSNSIYVNNYLYDGMRRGSHRKRQENSAKYRNGWVDRGWYGDKGPGYLCGVRPILPLTNSKSEVMQAVDGMVANGWTNITEGLMWGLRTISPHEPFSEGKDYGEDKHHKIIILLTDGRNQYPDPRWLGGRNINRSEFGPYGFMPAGRLVASTSLSQIEREMNNRTEEACEAVKDEDIQLFTITFAVNDPNTEALMRDCATDPSMYYNSPDTSTLDDVFKAIATRISELRISK